MMRQTLAIATLCWASLVPAEESTRHNPFQRTASLPTLSQAEPASTTVTAHPTTHPRLRGVLQAIDGSLANLDGHVLAQGESALGYTLVAVQGHSAKFRFHHRLITLQVTEDRP